MSTVNFHRNELFRILQDRRLKLGGLKEEKARAFSPDQFPFLFPWVRKTNILKDIRSLQLSPWGNILRRKHHIIRKLICQESSTFKRICGFNGPKPMFYQSNRIYSNNYRRCCYSFGGNDKPFRRTLFNLPSSPKDVVDALFCEFNTDKVSNVTEDFRSHLVTLSEDNHLCLLDLDSGRVMRKIFLSNIFIFSKLYWNTYGESFVVKAMCDVFGNSSTLNFIVFQVFPLRLHSHVALLPQVFHTTLTDANIYEGLLVVEHHSHIVIYSYDRFVEEFTNKTVSLDRLSPDGIPPTVDVHVLPPELIFIGGQYLEGFGGVPPHYLLQPTCLTKGFQVCHWQADRRIENGLIPSVGPNDKLSFLGNSNMLVHATDHCAKILKIEMTDQGIRSLCKLFPILPHKFDERRKQKNVHRMKSVEYNDDLSLMVSTSVFKESRWRKTAFVCFHDDQTGYKLKTVELEENWDETDNHRIILDMDTLIVTYNYGYDNKCFVYRLDRSIPEDSLETKQKKERLDLKLSEIHL